MKKPVIIILALLLLNLTGCGYQSPYSQPTQYDQDGDGIVTVYLETWDNQTNLLEFPAAISQQLTAWLKKSQRFILTSKRDQANFILSGAIHNVDIPGLAYGDFDRASELRIKTKLSYQLRDAETGKEIMAKKNFYKYENMAVGANSIQTKANQRTALIALADNLADDIYIQLFYIFTRDDLAEERQIMPTEDIITLD
ncbi:MAG: LPS assembly lipoprotein LptE [Thermodesulfobacteriota bacterium]